MNTKTVNLENLFLDPNNFRLRNQTNYKFINSKALTSQSVQSKTMNMICGDGNVLIIDLIESFKSNGYLKVDNILVRKHDKENYIVIEGNRRIAALKVLMEMCKKGYDIGKLTKDIFEKGIEVVETDSTDPNDYLILMGLKHVSGNKKWERYNQAKLLYELKDSLNCSDGDLAKKIGISKTEVEQNIRGYKAMEIFLNDIKDETYKIKFNPYDKIMIFIEMTNKPQIRKWVGWNEKHLKFDNQKNMKRFFSWIKPATIYNDETEVYEPREPIIKSHKEVRNLEEIINDAESLKIMENIRDFDFALNQNYSYTKKQFSSTIRSVEQILKNIKTGSSLKISREDKEVLYNIKKMVDKFLK